MDCDPCNICGCTEVNLVDGFQYCTECGTQNTEFRETVIEYLAMDDGGFQNTQIKKIVLPQVEDGAQMTDDWITWHAYNFIVAGLVDELISLGARPSFKMKMLWIWTRYIKKFKTETNNSVSENLLNQQYENEDLDEENEIDDKIEEKLNSKSIGIKKMSMINIYAMLYIALNLDSDDIKLSDLRRFIREGRISYQNVLGLLPADLNKKRIKYWGSFLKSCFNLPTTRKIRQIALIFMKELDLGIPVTPDYQQLVKLYIKELQLPSALIDFVKTIMALVPVGNENDSLEHLVYWPDFEGRAMSYIIVSLKILFGLDDDYENSLSNKADEINKLMNYEKVSKQSMFMEHTERLFDWRSWCTYIEYRKICISKYYYPVASISSLSDADDELVLSHIKNISVSEERDFSSDITMEILSRLATNENIVKPAINFKPSLTPLTTYTETLLLSNIDDTNLIKEILLEDFSIYSLKYLIDPNSLSLNAQLAESLSKFCGPSMNRKKVDSSALENKNNNKFNQNIVYCIDCSDKKDWRTEDRPKFIYLNRLLNSVDENEDHGYGTSIDGLSEASVQNCRSQPTTLLSNINEPNILAEVTQSENTIGTQQGVSETIIESNLNDVSIISDEDRDTIANKLFEKILAKNNVRLKKRKLPDRFVVKDQLEKTKRIRNILNKEDRGVIKNEVNSILNLYQDYINTSNKENVSCIQIDKQMDDNILETESNNLSTELHDSLPSMDCNALSLSENHEESEVENQIKNTNPDDQFIQDDYGKAKMFLQNRIQRFEKEILNDESDDSDDNTIFDQHITQSHESTITDGNTEPKICMDTPINETEILQTYDQGSDSGLECDSKSNISMEENACGLRVHEGYTSRDHIDTKENIGMHNQLTRVEKSDLPCQDFASENFEIEGDESKSTEEKELLSQDLPLNVYFQNNSLNNSTEDQEENTPSVMAKEFHNYWIRHYEHSHCILTPIKFETELESEFPKSFAWLLRQCMAAIESSSVELYGQVIILEDQLSCKINCL